MNSIIILLISSLALPSSLARNYDVDNSRSQTAMLSKDLVSIYSDWSRKSDMKRRLYEYYPGIKTGWPDNDYAEFAKCHATPNSVGGPEAWFNSKWRDGWVWKNFLGTNRNYQDRMYGEIAQCGFLASKYDSDYAVGADSLSFGTHYDAVDSDPGSRGKTCSPKMGCIELIISRPPDKGAGAMANKIRLFAHLSDRIHESAGCYPRKGGNCSFFKGPQLDLPGNIVTIVKNNFDLKEWTHNLCVTARMIPCDKVPKGYTHLRAAGLKRGTPRTLKAYNEKFGASTGHVLRPQGYKSKEGDIGRSLTLQEYLEGGRQGEGKSGGGSGGGGGGGGRVRIE